MRKKILFWVIAVSVITMCAAFMTGCSASVRKGKNDIAGDSAKWSPAIVTKVTLSETNSTMSVYEYEQVSNQSLSCTGEFVSKIGSFNTGDTLPLNIDKSRDSLEIFE